MKHNQPGRAQRGAFTLIELLVVIAIIAILVSLTAAGVMKLLYKGPKIKTQSEIGQLDIAIQAAESEFGVPYLPSLLILREDNQYYNKPLDPTSGVAPKYANTVTFLSKAFGKQLNLVPTTTNNPLMGGINWTGDGVIDHVDHVLEGQHCLVFWLGGIPTPPGGANGVLGFSTNPTNPAAPVVAGQTRRGPFYNQFESTRLWRDTNGFFYYLDAWASPSVNGPGGKPYAYFSAYGKPNGYTNSWGVQLTLKSDCPSLGFVYPGGAYYQVSGSGTTALVNYNNPRTHQIFSAGQDQAFGTGGQWDSASGTVASQADKDNQTNFAGNSLASGGQ
jgi:prepilin-type N-terminal cleavage/methylation domain-containing protein